MTRARRNIGLALVPLMALAACRSEPTAAVQSADITAVAAIRAAAHPITGSAADYNPLLTLTAGARVVMLGESTHGSREYYEERARITQRLVSEQGYRAILIEGDWPRAYQVNEYIRGLSDGGARESLSGFTGFPVWMWANEEIASLVEWLRAFNAGKPASQQVGFYGMDVYSLYPSIDEVLEYLDEHAPAVRTRVASQYACFEPYRPNNLAYGSAALSGAGCEVPAARALREIEALQNREPASPAAAEALFAAIQNARSVVSAESYFRTAYSNEMSTWNLRDARMLETTNAVDAHLQSITGAATKMIVWAHNTHSGGARLTEAGATDEFNVGQLLRQQHGQAAVLVGFYTYSGQVLAASAWDQQGFVQTLRPAQDFSYEHLFHATGVPQFLLMLRDTDAGELLTEQRYERAVGVVYAPATEIASHYFRSRLGSAFDAVVFVDQTTPVRPLR